MAGVVVAVFVVGIIISSTLVVCVSARSSKTLSEENECVCVCVCVLLHLMFDKIIRFFASFHYRPPTPLFLTIFFSFAQRGQM